jgi:uncharacterized repeat protein (TIGR03803 family)
MHNKKLSLGMSAVLAICALTTLLAGSRAFAQQEKLLHSFNGPGDAGSPGGGLIFDKAGNLYGIGTSGGVYGYGAVYELSPNGKERVLYSFNPAAGDGGNPMGGLIFDATGNLYGTTYAGGSGFAGTVFELTPHGNGLWEERILHNFKLNPPDGSYPSAGLIFDAAGNLYGTTAKGGSGPCMNGRFLVGCGAVYELSPKAGGVWAGKIIYSFNGAYEDGENPIASLIVDSAGNLYGTTIGGGSGGPINSGTVFELSPNGSGGWTEAVLYNFSNAGTDGYNPGSSLVLDSAGNLYSTTNTGGLYDFGTLFELSPSGGGSWTETILHNFGGSGDGRIPQGGVIFDASGNLYGTADSDGDNSKGPNYGMVYEMTPAAGGGWTENILFTFDGKDGYEPEFGVVLDGKGNLYGTTQYGGAYSAGNAFEIVP